MEDLAWLESIKDLGSYAFLIVIFGYMIKKGIEFLLERERKHIPELSDSIKTLIEANKEANKEFMEQLKEIIGSHKGERTEIIDKFTKQLDMAAELRDKKENVMIETLEVIKELLMKMRGTQMDEIEKGKE